MNEKSKGLSHEPYLCVCVILRELVYVVIGRAEAQEQAMPLFEEGEGTNEQRNEQEERRKPEASVGRRRKKGRPKKKLHRFDRKRCSNN